MPPIKYLIYKRMEHAKQLLISDNGMSINEIAEECGYSDTAYFCRVFKKTVDITPLQYKIKHLRRNKNLPESNRQAMCVIPLYGEKYGYVFIFCRQQTLS